MTPALYHFHAGRLRRMLRDLGIDPASLLIREQDTFAIFDTVDMRSVTPPLDNQTLAEGLLSAIKLAEAAVDGTLP